MKTEISFKGNTMNSWSFTSKVEKFTNSTESFSVNTVVESLFRLEFLWKPHIESRISPDQTVAPGLAELKWTNKRGWFFFWERQTVIRSHIFPSYTETSVGGWGLKWPDNNQISCSVAFFRDCNGWKMDINGIHWTFLFKVDTKLIPDWNTHKHMYLLAVDPRRPG